MRNAPQFSFQNTVFSFALLRTTAHIEECMSAERFQPKSFPSIRTSGTSDFCAMKIQYFHQFQICFQRDVAAGSVLWEFVLVFFYKTQQRKKTAVEFYVIAIFFTARSLKAALST